MHLKPNRHFTGGRPHRMVAGALASFFVLGCHSGSASRKGAIEAGVSSTWPDVMSSWKAPGADSIYSLSFFDQPPEGMFVRAVSYASSAGNACETLHAEEYLQRSSKSDYWILLMQVSSYEPTEYQVGPRDLYGKENTAQVLVKHVVGGKEVERHTGLAGTMEATVSPGTMQSQIDGTPFAIQGNVEFSQNESLQQGCSAGGAVNGTDGPPPESTCYCLDAAGVAFTCPGRVGQPSCCIDRDAPRWVFPIAITAAPCANACVVTDLTLRRHCIELGASSSSI